MMSPRASAHSATSPAARLEPPRQLRRETLHASVAAEGLATAIPFLDAVALQVERLEPANAVTPGGPEGELLSFSRAYMLLCAALLARYEDQLLDAPARALLDHPAMYAAFVQNIDLLFAARSPAADAVASLLAAALDR